MLSKYFEVKTKTDKFNNDLNTIIEGIKGKKIIIYGAGEAFVELNKKWKFAEALTPIAIADKKFEQNNPQTFEGIRTISPKEIINEDFDVILISNENPKGILNYLGSDLKIDFDKLIIVFKEDIPDEQVNYNYLVNFDFDKNLQKLVKKLKNKTVLLYGAGAFLELIKKYYDISELNIVGIADRRFTGHSDNEEFLGYKVYAPDEIVSVKPDCVVVATKFYINIMEDLYYNTLKGQKIKIVPLVKKPFWTIVKEIWS